MRRVSLASALLMLFAISTSLLDAEDRRGAARLSCWQGGIPTQRIVLGEPFQVRGTGFKPSLPVSVCFSGQRCLHSEVDATGTFIQNRTLREEGRYIVTVRQARSLDLDQWILRASQPIQVVREE